MVRVRTALRSSRLDSSNAMPFRTGHSTKRPAEGLRQASGEGVCRERTQAGGGQTGRPMAHLPPVSRGTTACQNGEGQEGGCTRSRFPPSVETKLCLSILPPRLRKPGVGDALRLLHTLTAPAVCHEISFVKAVDLTCPPNSSAGSAAPKIHNQARCHT